MHQQNFQDILGLVQTPTRYTGDEVNAVKKDWNTVSLSFALVFPDLYEIGISHFGLQILYSILNREKQIAAERFFAPAPDMEHLMKDRSIPCLSLESQKPLSLFDIIGISLLYELNFTNILTIFSLSGIPFYAADRDDTFPLVIGGGPCAYNPEPLADFFDAFVIGDGEEAVLEISRRVIDFKNRGGGGKQMVLKQLSEIDGVYVPSFFTPGRNTNNGQVLTPKFDHHRRIRRAFLPELTKENFPQDPIVPFGKPVHDRLRLEIARGCTRGCRFCQAGMIYRPVRERSVPDLLDITRHALKSTGYSDISLLSLSTGDYSRLSELMQLLLQLGQGHCNAISLPSIRAEKLTPELMGLIKTVRKTGFTIAPEAGTQRLRDIINKNLTEEDITATVENAFALGWKNIKLYFMMGLPHEEDADIDGICTLSKRLASAYAKGKRTLNVSLTTFIPKAHTPFQTHAQLTLSQTREKLAYVKANLRHPKVNLKWQDPRMSLLEGVFARGDRRLSALLVSAFEKGCRLDGWSDRFDFSLWEQAFDATGIDPSFYTSRQRQAHEALPWDHIDAGVTRKFLEKERQKADIAALTPDCRENECTGCGVCDFKRIKPRLHKSPADLSPLSEPVLQLDDEAFAKFEVRFSKLGPARFFGHLEMATIFQRAVKRTGLKVKYSKGFNPSMRISFDNALPVGLESEEEVMSVFFEKTVDPMAVRLALNHTLPAGLVVTTCRLVRRPAKSSRGDSAVYRIRLSGCSVSRNDVERFLATPEFVVEDLTKKGKIRKTDLRQCVESITLGSDGCLEICMVPYNGRNIRPAAVLKTCFNLTENDIQLARIRKLKQG